ncbi:spore germination protein GerW family protein [Natrinema sp. 1APR25-10V2]|uniref:GerW family sporulation protein n=1 Tax=Natrinema sp. 1APR25-10V2 TaxID=2951081 RepID=UPI0028757515|nr:spore germination protein GerW family protein [Natrinema sp. 1APR25-10V2]MDS0477721.1 sporulation protein YtfJ [Natrinema sp. 1APR25-10V2]
MNVIDRLTTVLEPLHGSASVKSVYGDPIEANGRTIIPVAKVAYGFGAGYGSSPEKSPDDQPTQDNEGGGLGGGVSAKPVGVVEITESETRFVRPTSTRRRITVLLACLLAGYLLGHRK